MKHFDIMGVHWKNMILRGVHEKPIYLGKLHKKRGRPGLFADLKEGLAKRKGLMFLRWD